VAREGCRCGGAVSALEALPADRLRVVRADTTVVSANVA
jgi:hypothetical protein